MKQNVIASKHPTGYSVGTHTVLDGYSHGYLDTCGPTVFARGQFVEARVLKEYSRVLTWHKVLKGYFDTCGPIVFASDRGVSVGVHLSRNDVKSDFLVAPRGTADRLLSTEGTYSRGSLGEV